MAKKKKNRELMVEHMAALGSGTISIPDLAKAIGRKESTLKVEMAVMVSDEKVRAKQVGGQTEYYLTSSMRYRLPLLCKLWKRGVLA